MESPAGNPVGASIVNRGVALSQRRRAASILSCARQDEDLPFGLSKNLSGQEKNPLDIQIRHEFYT